MRLFGLTVAFVALMGVVASAAQRRTVHADWPTVAQVEKAAERIKYNTENSAKEKWQGRQMVFAPCEVGDIPDATKLKGFILGKLTVTKGSPDKLPDGAYLVFAKKNDAAGVWQVFFCNVRDKEPVAKSTEVLYDNSNKREPEFQVDNTTVRFWHLRFAY